MFNTTALGVLVHFLPMSTLKVCPVLALKLCVPPFLSALAFPLRWSCEVTAEHMRPEVPVSFRFCLCLPRAARLDGRRGGGRGARDAILKVDMGARNLGMGLSASAVLVTDSVIYTEEGS